ncbi:MAG TPA: DUF2199 domain-containing protein [Acidobacteriaceae bacterium]|jgi:hypothetical protein|nr:DUF2199 domain-containing protein [Acidobacteriaceae bacterium]
MESDATPGFLCRICGRRHVLPLSYSVKAPLAVASIPPNEIASRVVITPEQCVIDNRSFYLRGRIPVPIHGPTGILDQPFIWGVWAEISPKNFLRTQQLWKMPGRESEPPFPGFLNSEIAPYGQTLDLELTVHTQPVGRRPHFYLTDPIHPLAIEQRTGITLPRVEEIAERLLHPQEISEASASPTIL